MLDAVLQHFRKLGHYVAPVILIAGLQAPLAEAQQSGLLIWPVSPTIQNNNKAEALWLENTGRTPMTMQVRVFSWQQSNYENVFENQNFVIPSPPMARIEPGQKQLVRLIKSMPVPAGQEKALRIRLDEVPIPDVERPKVNGLGILMRYSIPLYVYGDGLSYKARKARRSDADIPDTGAPQVTWKIIRAGSASYVAITISGNVHAQMSKGIFSLPGGKQVELSRSGVGTVLPGSTMRWPLPAGVDARATLTMKVNGSKDQVVIEKAM